MESAVGGLPPLGRSRAGGLLERATLVYFWDAWNGTAWTSITRDKLDCFFLPSIHFCFGCACWCWPYDGAADARSSCLSLMFTISPSLLSLCSQSQGSERSRAKFGLPFASLRLRRSVCGFNALSSAIIAGFTCCWAHLGFLFAILRVLPEAFVWQQAGDWYELPC